MDTLVNKIPIKKNREALVAIRMAILAIKKTISPIKSKEIRKISQKTSYFTTILNNKEEIFRTTK